MLEAKAAAAPRSRSGPRLWLCLLCVAVVASPWGRVAVEAEAAAASASDAIYCSLCPDHSVCVYRSPAPRCRNLAIRELTSLERNTVLHLHNALRNRVASGEEHRGRISDAPTVANMHKLNWDEELAYIARHWATQCTFEQDNCRTSADNTSVGQNVYMQIGAVGQSLPTLALTLESAVKTWYDEVDMFDAHQATQPYTYSATTWHFTNAMWARTTRLGCAFADFTAPNGAPSRLIVCNYKESGNVLGTPMFVAGRPGSQCIPSMARVPALQSSAYALTPSAFSPSPSSVHPWDPDPSWDPELAMWLLETQGGGLGRSMRGGGLGPGPGPGPGPSPGPGLRQKPTRGDGSGSADLLLMEQHYPALCL